MRKRDLNTWIENVDNLIVWPEPPAPEPIVPVPNPVSTYNPALDNGEERSDNDAVNDNRENPTLDATTIGAEGSPRGGNC